MKKLKEYKEVITLVLITISVFFWFGGAKSTAEEALKKAGNNEAFEGDGFPAGCFAPGLYDQWCSERYARCQSDRKITPSVRILDADIPGDYSGRQPGQKTKRLEQDYKIPTYAWPLCLFLRSASFPDLSDP